MNEALKIQPMSTEFEPQYDPLVPYPEYIKDPYPTYRQLREHQPMYRSPHGLWLASRYREIALLLKDKRFGRGYFYFEGLAKRQGPAILEEPIYKSARNMMLMKDGVEHNRARGLIAQVFSKGRMEALRPQIQRIANGLIDKVVDQGGLDVMADIAFPMPSAVICCMLGVPEEDWGLFCKRTATGSRALEPAPLSREELDEQNVAIQQFNSYFEWLIEWRRSAPGDDLISALIGAEYEGNRPSDELIDNIRMIFVGGIETTVNTIGNGLLALFCHPDQLDKLRADPALIPSAVSEVIRYDSSVQMTPRQTLEDTEIGGVLVKKGETVLCVLGSANRDDDVYADADRFDVTRAQGLYPLSFGGGQHFCIGALLSRLEAEIALDTVLRRLPTLRPIDIDNPSWLPGTVVFRGLATLPATL